MILHKIDELTRIAYEIHNRKIELERLIETTKNDVEFPLHYRNEILDVYESELHVLKNNLKNLENLLPRLYNDMHIIDGFNNADDKEAWKMENIAIMMGNIEQTNNSNLNSVDKRSFIKTINDVIYSISRL